MNDREKEVKITAKAAQRLKDIMQIQGKENIKLRLQVSGGGCNGFQYDFSISTNINENDHIFTKDGIAVLIDNISLKFLIGAEIDFVSDMMGSTFRVNNPNVNSACGCGTSFSL